MTRSGIAIEHKPTIFAGTSDKQLGHGQWLSAFLVFFSFPNSHSYFHHFQLMSGKESQIFSPKTISQDPLLHISLVQLLTSPPSFQPEYSWSIQGDNNTLGNIYTHICIYVCICICIHTYTNMYFFYQFLKSNSSFHDVKPQCKLISGIHR